MNIIAHDIYAETNPAFCAAVLADFCSSYHKYSEHPPNLLMTYVVLPITLSDDLAVTFDGTNVRTGLLEWLNRNPIIFSGLSKRINKTLWITSQAIQYGCLYQLLQLNADGSLSATTKKLPPQTKKLTDKTVNPVFKRTQILGSWCAKMGSTRAVIEALGVEI